MTAILSWVFSPLGRFVSGAAAILVFLGMFASQQREVALVKVERNNVQLSKKAGTAGRKSLDPNARGVLLPYYRD